MEINFISVFLVFTLAALVQTVAGFGAGLVSMSLLPALIGLKVSIPLVAAAAILIELVVLIRFRESLQVKQIWRLVLASLVSVPIGVGLLAVLDEHITLTVLGLILVGYGAYGLFGFQLGRLINPAWQWLAGFLGGLLGGAYNTAGPPVIMYFSTQDWEPSQFKSNLQGYFIINSIQILISHWLAGNFNMQVIKLGFPTAGGLLLGIGFGFIVERFVQPLLFKRLVFLLLVIMGLRFLLNQWI